MLMGVSLGHTFPTWRLSVKVGDLVKHKVCGVGIILCSDTEKNDGEIVLYYSTNKRKKVVRSRVDWLRVVNESR